MLNFPRALIYALALTIAFFVSNASSAKALNVLNCDASFFPKVRLSLISKEEKDVLEEHIVLKEDGKLLGSYRLTKTEPSNNEYELSFLSSSSSSGVHEVTIEYLGSKVSASYESTRWRRFGENESHKLKLIAKGPKGIPIPCRLIALHESGKVFEDFLSTGGYGRLGTGFIVPPGDYYAELRLQGIDFPFEHFRFIVKGFRDSKVVRRFGFLKLPGKGQGIEAARNVHIRLRRTPSFFPSLAMNLANLRKNLPKGLPKDRLPLPSGKYKVRLSPSTLATSNTSFLYRELCFEVIAGQETPFPMSK